MKAWMPTGQLQGDDKPMRDAGTSTGMNGDTYGASLDQSATNSMGRLGGATKSDEALDNCAKDPMNGRC